jgi:hypothetical protein
MKEDLVTETSPSESQDQRVAKPAPVVVAAVLLGIAADFLFWPHGPFNLALCLWLLLFCATASAFAWRARLPWCLTVILGCSAAVVAAVLLLFRDLPILVLATLGILFAAGLQILLRTGGIGFLEARIYHVFRAALALVWQASFGVLPLLSTLDMTSSWTSPRTRGITRGVLLALPLLVLFIALFSSADAGFSRFVPNLHTFFNSDTPGHIALVAVFTVMSGGLLAGALKTRSLAATPVPLGKLGAEETGIVLGLLSVLFVSFVLFQLSYLFGGQANIEATTGLTVANYARRGFFELLWVAALTLALLLIIAKVTKAPRLLKIFGSVMVGCVLIMLVSAAQRMLLYVDSFGLSMDRVTACVVMVWIASTLLLCAATVLRRCDAGFASGMVNLGMLCIFGLILLNPAKLVATINVERALASQEPLDVVYFLRRNPSADAVAPLLAHFDEFPAVTQCDIAIGLLAVWPTPDLRAEWQLPVKQEGMNWRGWNYSQRNAQQLIAANADKLQAIYYQAMQTPQTPVPALSPQSGMQPTMGPTHMTACQ